MMLDLRSDLLGREEPEATVYVVDDDPFLRNALNSLFRSVGLKVRLFGAASDLLQNNLVDGTSCLVLDIRLPGVGGLEFQTQMVQAGIKMPIIFMTGYANIPMSVRAMKAGAIDFLTKPFQDQDMLDAVYAALDIDRKRRAADQSCVELTRRYETLTAREKEVMAYVVSGLMNKQIAGKIGLSEITVKIHRSHLMKKLAAGSLAELVRIAERLKLSGRE